MSAFDVLEQQLREAARRRRARRRLWPLLVPAAATAFAAAVVLWPADPPDEREAATPAPAATWTPVLGDDDRGHPSISRSPVPPEQAAKFAILRRPATAADRSAKVRELLRFAVNRHTESGVRVDAIRLLQTRSNGITILIPVEDFHPNPRDRKYDVRDALCLVASYDGKGAGGTCGSTEDALSGAMRWTLPPAGLAPDGAARVDVRVRGGLTISAPARNNYYDLARPGKPAYAGIARPRFFDAQGREL